MKKLTFLICIFCIFAFQSVFSQNIGLYAGANIANMKTSSADTSFTVGIKPTYVAGLSMEYPMVPETFYIQLNIEAVGKGAIDSKNSKNKTSLHTAQVNVGPKYRAKFGYSNNWFIGTYGYIGYAYLGKGFSEGQPTKDLNFGTDKAKDDFNGLDYGISFDTGFGFSGFNIGYRYNLPLANASLLDKTTTKFTSQNIYLAYFFSQN